MLYSKRYLPKKKLVTKLKVSHFSNDVSVDKEIVEKLKDKGYFHLPL